LFHTIRQRSSILESRHYLQLSQPDEAHIQSRGFIINNYNYNYIIIIMTTRSCESASESDNSEDSESQYTYGDDSTVLSLRHTLTSNDDRPEADANANHNPHTRSQLAGAAICGGVAGFVVGGPLVGAVAAGASALAVTSRSPPGKVARAGGEAVARVGTRVGDNLQALDEKHSISPRFQQATQAARAKLQAMDEKHHWSQNSKQAMSRIGGRLQQMEEKHHILDRASDGWCAKRFEPRPQRAGPRPPSTETKGEEQFETRRMLV
jgi:hypothetical protein